MTGLDPGQALQVTHYLDHTAESVQYFAHQVIGAARTDRDKAVALFYAVRDGLRYDPYVSSDSAEDYRASVIATTDRSWCVPKSILLTAAARAVGVPSALGFADVKNHLASDKLLERVGTDLFAFHGYSLFWLDGRWVKVTSAFNLEMCTRFGVKPLEFDGVNDSLYHEFDVEGRRHMEYVNQRGEYLEFPWDEMCRVFNEVYGRMPGQDPGAEAVHDAAFHD
jgi:transglutaminase-like putative cysteine protease